MKKVFLYVVVIIVFSCGKKEEGPADILSQEQMVSLLIDIREAEGKVATVTISKDSANIVYKELERRIFEKQQVDSALYQKSYDYYLLHTKKFIEITNVVIDSLKMRQQYLTSGRRSSK
ncbi:DUF4296 domain-containing protein [Roseivirga misakiensis]|uniref:DUF4296 domain-containing protein n=1 Tax=Roseivirga misakiensis TaxID=1563681 RepID=A0A1E5SKP9_9BACT|nr:DUF4296 domain-containing protein [Roseivirga misakiensis]OEJ99681.1 hypothetical protein BFP71_08920 [Roseivirga misakiensis]